MEFEILFKNVGYCGKASEDYCTEGPPALNFINIVAWVSSQLVKLCELENHVNYVSDEEDSLGFLVEVSSILKELACPYKSLIKGQITERLSNSDDKKLLLRYLCTELEAVKILTSKNPQKKRAVMQIDLEESKTAKELREMLVCLGFSKPPASITPDLLFQEVEKRLELLSQPLTPNETAGKLLFSGCLTEKQWFQLEHLYKEMYEEYSTRRSLLLTRLDVTVKSFLWSDRLKSKAEEVMSIYHSMKSGITIQPFVLISHILAAREDLAFIQKTSCASVRKNTKSSVNNKIIGVVPDRGGRPEEHQPPPPEVPSWQNNDLAKERFKSSNYPSSTRSGQQNRVYSGCDNAKFNKNQKCYGFSANQTNLVGNTIFGFNKNSVRSNYHPRPPFYYPVTYCPQPDNNQVGFGGYNTPAGDNFRLYGPKNESAQINHNKRRNTAHYFRGGYSEGKYQSRKDR